MAVMEYARIIYEDSSDDETETIEKIDNYAECTIPHMSDKQFQTHFRMSPSTFEDLLRRMHTVQQQNNYNHVGYPRTDLVKEAMIMIWYLGNLKSFR
jgi:hypothetical protein